MRTVTNATLYCEKNRCSKEVMVMTPNALLNLLHRGTEYLSLRDVGVLVFDECHKARKRHPYARVMGFYLELSKQGGPLPKVKKLSW